uniref:TF-B3 domain-containing protein n=1 Tax=Salix viminalis TaxID=40686 RepID=A0A6N2KAG7_SALVM
MANLRKTLSETDVEIRFSVPSKWFRENLYSRFEGKFVLDLRVKDRSGEVQSFGFSVRTKGKHLKPVISRGWRKFVHAKGLKPGNKIVFVRENDPEMGTEYTVEVVKEIKLFGRDIQGRV